MTSLIPIAPWRNQEICRYFEYLTVGPFRGLNFVIAGGSVRSLYTKEKLGESDIDIWFHSEAELAEAATRLKAVQYPNVSHDPERYWSKPFIDTFCQVATTVNGFTFKMMNVNDPVLPYMTAIQLLRKQTESEGVAGVIDLFDFTICQFAYTNGMIYASPAAIADHKGGILRRNPKCTQVVCYDRAVKYMAKGYTPTPQLFDKMFLETHEKMTPGTVELTNVFYEDGFKQVI